MGSRDDQSDREILEEIVADTRRLIVDTRTSRREWRELVTEVETTFKRGKMTQLTYDIHKERLRRSGQDIDYCLRNLDRQMKIALQKLRELDEGGAG
jgi:major membrane immunogen (membrane-anchored lipoprotein)